MPAIVNVGDFIKVGLMAFIFIWGANKVMTTFGLPQFTTTGATN